MKKIISALALSALIATPIFADDVEVIELESVSEPAVSQADSTPEPTSADMAQARLDAERLVREAYYTLREFESKNEFSKEIKSRLGQARAVLIFPEVLKVGWVLGVSGGQGVLLARSKTGEWSYPTFYSLTQASVGLQFGADSSRVLMLVMNGKGLGAIIDDNIQVGASVNAAAGSQGGGLGYGTTSNFRKDIITYANSKGAFIGASIEGASIEPNDLMNTAYYGSSDATTQSVIIDGQHANKSANAFREYLTQFKYQYD